MCRLTAYKGKPILIGSIVTKPNNSLLYQSRDAAYHPGVKDDTHHRNILVNGDGFGVSWYDSDPSKIDRGSCCFKFVTPAWSNQNLQNIGDHVASPLVFAHIRAASSGHNPFERISVNHENCHPFTYQQFTFMHNGGIPYFSKIKLRLLNLLSDNFFQEIKGSTDSEHIFALFLTILFTKYPLPTTGQRHTVEEIIDALNTAISTIIQLCPVAAERGEDPNGHNACCCSLNICLTDGRNMIATRFRNGPQCPPSLYYNYGSNFDCEDGIFYPKDGVGGPASDVVISSAPLSKVSPIAVNGQDIEEQQQSSSSTGFAVTGEEENGTWILMPKNHMLVCRGENPENPYLVTSVELKPVLVGDPFPGYNNYVANNPKAEVIREEEEERDHKNDRLKPHLIVADGHCHLIEKPKTNQIQPSADTKPGTSPNSSYLQLIGLGGTLASTRSSPKIVRFRSKLL